MGDKPLHMTSYTTSVNPGAGSGGLESSHVVEGVASNGEEEGNNEEENNPVSTNLKRSEDAAKAAETPLAPNELATQKGESQPKAPAAHEFFVKKHIDDIGQFSRDVYSAITSSEQSYSVEHRINPGESCTLILRRVRGGGLEKLE